MKQGDISWQTQVLEKFDLFIESDGHRFRDNQPFPHIYVDNLFPESVIDKILEEFPPANDPIWEASMVKDTQNNKSGSHPSRKEKNQSPSLQHRFCLSSGF